MKITDQAKRKVMAVATACVLAASTMLGAAAPAIAAPGGSNPLPSRPAVVPTATENKVTITKTLKGAETALPAAQQFTFHFEKTKLNEVGAADVTDVPAIDDKQITIGTEDANHLIKETDGTTATLTQNLEIDLSTLVFPHAGLYSWIVTETGTVDGVTMSQATYTLRIYHTNDGKNTITVEKTKDDNGGTNGAGKVDPNPVDPSKPVDPVNPNNPDSHKSGFIFNNVIAAGTITGANNLKITKTVAGAMGDQTRKFAFHLTLTKPATSDATSVMAKVYNANDTEEDTEIEFTYGVATDFSLSHGQYLKFEDGMVDGTTYVLTEDGVTSYTASASTVTGGGTSVAATKAADGQSAIAEGNGVQATASATNAGVNTGSVTNTFANVTPTGIAISVLPYAVMVAVPVAAAAAWIASRRRNGQNA